MKTGRVSGFARPAVYLVNRLGDQLVALPALRALAAMFPGGLQLLLGESMFGFFYRGLPVGEPVRVRWDDYAAGSIDAARIAASAQPCDLFVCLSPHSDPSVAALARRMGASWAVGYCEHLDQPIDADDSAHMFDRVFAVPRHLEPSLRLEDFSAPPVFSPAAEAAAARRVAGLAGSGERILFLHPETGPERQWPRERFAWVVARFLAERPDYRVIVSSLAPIDLGVNGGRVVRIDDHLELTLALMRYVDLFLGVDSCFLHAADLFRTPGVALFGPTKPRHWGFRLSPRGRHVSATSMDRISAGSVLDALLAAAAAAEDRPPAARVLSCA